MHLIDQQLNLMIRGRFEEAWSISQKLEEEMPDNLRHKFNRGWFLINQGKFQEGFQMLEAGRFLNVYGGGRLPTDKPIWRQEDLTGKTVILNMEGGYGDNIIYARFATEVHKLGGTAIICCDRELHCLFNTIPGISKCITLGELAATRHDYWIPGFSCSWLFGYDSHNMPNEPFISANPHSVELWKQIIKSDKPKVGIRWSGNPKFEHQQFRIFPPENIINFRKYDVQLYSLQRDNDVRELPEDVVDLQHLLISWADTAAVIQNLDLVLTSCTSIAHLSAAMGKPTWVITPILPYHVWAYGGDHSPWYQKTTRVFRQKTFGEWDDAFAEIEAEFVKYFNLKEPNA